MVNINDPDDELPSIGDIIRHKGHYKSPLKNVEKEQIPEEDWEYEPKYSGEVIDRIFSSGSVLIKIKITETEDPEFFNIGDTAQISADIIQDEDYYAVE